MNDASLSIGDLADAAGLTRRAIRFYVQQKLIPPPVGRGRGSHYDGRHLAHLRKVLELQQAGHSLEAIRQVLDAQSDSDAPKNGVAFEKASFEKTSRRRREPGGSAAGPSDVDIPNAPLRAALWTRLTISEGVELSFDATKFNPTVEQLLRLRTLIRGELRRDTGE